MVDKAVIEWISERVLTATMVFDVVEAVERQFANGTDGGESNPKLVTRASAVRTKIARLVDALAMGADSLEAVVERLRVRQQELNDLERRLAAPQRRPRRWTARQRRMLRDAARRRLEDLKGALERNPAEGKVVIRSLF